MESPMELSHYYTVGDSGFTVVAAVGIIFGENGLDGILQRFNHHRARALDMCSTINSSYGFSIDVITMVGWYNGDYYFRVVCVPDWHQ